MPFFSEHQLLKNARLYPDSFILDQTSGVKYSYAELQELIRQQISAYQQQMPATLKRPLIVVFARNNVQSLVGYLAALQMNACVLLADDELVAQKKQQILSGYPANLILDNTTIQLRNTAPIALQKELGLLLSTSGSTGSAKLIKLSKGNLQANTNSICGYLPIQADHVLVTSLPMHYSFGLSMLNTHLFKGASIILTDASPMQSQFWQIYKEYRPQSFYGVPFSYELLVKLKLERLPLSSVRYFGQAGGRLHNQYLEPLYQFANQSDKLIYIMYGQTEATARIAYLPPEKLPTKMGFIGQAIPGGKLVLLDPQGIEISAPNTPGELCYQGDNVCLGTANSLQDLAVDTSIVRHGYLHTGDVALRDEAGDYQIVGRLKRMIKISGKRINLDETEHFVNTQLGLSPSAVAGEDDHLVVFYTSGEMQADAVLSKLSEELKVSIHYLHIYQIEEMPRLNNGKTDYQMLNQYTD